MATYTAATAALALAVRAAGRPLPHRPAVTGGLVLAPRVIRLVATVLPAVMASDFLEFAYAAAKRSGQERLPWAAGRPVSAMAGVEVPGRRQGSQSRVVND